MNHGLVESKKVLETITKNPCMYNRIIHAGIFVYINCLYSYVNFDIIPTDNTYFDAKMFFHFVYISIKKIFRKE